MKNKILIMALSLIGAVLQENSEIWRKNFELFDLKDI